MLHLDDTPLAHPAMPDPDPDPDPDPSRRGALAAFGVTALAFVAHSPSARARKKRKGSCRKKIRKQLSETCGKQIAECVAAYEEIDLPKFVPCCDFLATCDYTAFVECAT